jgi:hypothetical protein
MTNICPAIFIEAVSGRHNILNMSGRNASSVLADEVQNIGIGAHRPGNIEL